MFYTETSKRLEEELEVYGSGLKTSVQLTSYTFEVCDSVLNIAPIGFAAIGERSCDEDREDVKEQNAKCELEVVTSSGRGKNGALCVMQHSIKPQIITSFGLSGSNLHSIILLIENILGNKYFQDFWMFGLFLMKVAKKI